MTNQPGPLTWPNNAATIEQADPDGEYQTIAFFDGDYNFITAPYNKPTLFPYCKAPPNFFRQMVGSDFNG
ncbi:MAG: hypothetical protein JOZ35_22175, partial [Hyphomicrobiales bacterium]|nr:hypothetical protein [Hyphomicrobiales bacterium]